MNIYNEEECKRFYKIAKDRMTKGYSESAIFEGKPEGFSEWLKDTWPERKNIMTPKKDKVSLVQTCRSCGKKYGGTKCPYCGGR